ncbi:TonB-dependent receptor [Lentisphaera profundi]|uniref:TonB-dependent receptor n=1 Tax=Lentisphaera profundi TaxID=1658616 RepID=A0ABY7VNG1_9BACT|nr:TonB-dependent receptor [Lentisphaera profundi]WDE95658.1 TonB-dependent receptor [Lentisphaera profundi]
MRLIITASLIFIFMASAYSNEDLDELDLESLMNIEVTSVSKTAENSFTAASAIYVITQQEIARKGALNIAEALRGTPGVQVSRRTNNTWEVSIRGFDNLYSNKLLVLIDGRSVYSPIFSGTYWEFTNYPVADIERIEVIRGPGATVWGSNAVNGVINITTKSAKDTKGGLAKVDYGEYNESYYLRYGEALDEDEKLHLRIYGQLQKYQELEPGIHLKNTHENDDWDHLQGGFHLDFDVTSKDTLTVSSDIYHSDFTNYNALVINDFYEDGGATGYNLTLKHTREFNSKEKWNTLLYYDYHNIEQDVTLDSTVHAWNFETDYHFSPWKNHEMTIGAGVRAYRSKAKDKTGQLVFFPEDETTINYTLFVQDKITLQPDRWTLTLGSKFEKNDYTDYEYQPSARIAFTPNRKNTYWAAVSHAVRTPSRYEHGSNIFYGAAIGNNDVDSENLTAYELGHRILINEKLSFDTTVFYNDYSDLVTTNTNAGPDPITNDFSANSYGIEISSNYFITPDWQLKLSYSYFKIDTNYKDNIADTIPTEDVAATNKASFYSFYNITKDVKWDLMLYYQDSKNPSYNYDPQDGTPAFIKLDSRISWSPREDLEIYLVGQNLWEQSTRETLYYAETPRTFYLGLNYKF